MIVTIPTRREDSPPDTPPSLRIYTLQGIGRTIPLPEGGNYVEWMPDGKSICAVRYSYEIIDGKKKMQEEFFAIDVKAGTVTRQEKPPDTRSIPSGSNEMPESPLEYDEETVTQIDANGKKQKATGIWLHITEPFSLAKKSTDAPTPAPSNPLATDRLLVAINAHPEGIMAGSNINAVLFTQEGVVYASPIFRMTAAEYDRRMRDVQRTATLKNAKIIGIGVMMYTQDYDENYPLSGPDVPDSIGPYVKDSSVFNNPFSGDPGFVYSYKGGTDLTKIEKPGTTQLGYLPGFGGQAILWGDGHVTWQPNDAKP
ncbi:MAG: hypothetical protein EOP06_18215 [Proteobacteria bacterium]|nr:MAG: hypothetical protein EOP06_18215 [Pseudomonadota bacterium]